MTGLTFMTRHGRYLAAGLGLTIALTLSGCSLLRGDSGGDPSATPTPQVSPSVWVSKGKQGAVRTATAHLIRLSDVGSDYKSSALTLGGTPKGVKPGTCTALLGPALGVVGKPSGRASTSFVSLDGTTAIAQTVAQYPTATAATQILKRATDLAKTCKGMTAFGAKLTVKGTRTTIGGQPAVVVTQKQKTGAETITVVAAERLVSVVAIAALLPGPEEEIVQRASQATVTRLTATTPGAAD